MTNFSIPYTFVGGTKAKAEEVNANFSAVGTELLTKAELNGKSTEQFEVADATVATHAVSKSQLDSGITELENSTNAVLSKKAQNTPLTVISGNLNSDNQPDLIEIDDNTKIVFKIDDGTSYKPLKASLADGEIFELDEIDDFNVNVLGSGVNNIFVNKDGDITALNNKIFRQKTEPQTLVETDFTQPVFSANVALGGSTFGFEASSNSDYAYHHAFHFANYSAMIAGGNSIPYWQAAWNVMATYTIYNPTPLKGTFTFYGQSYVTCKIQGSSDGIVFNDVSGTLSALTSVLGFNKYSTVIETAYKYIRIVPLTVAAGSYILRIKWIDLTQMKEVVEGIKVNDIWINTTAVPYVVKKFNGSTYEDFNYVQLPQTVTITDGLITAATVISGYGMNRIAEIIAMPNYGKETSLTSGTSFIAPFDGWIKFGTSMFAIYQGSLFTPSAAGYKFYPINGV